MDCEVSFFLILGFVFRQDVLSLITGLGIGGVALALAARATLENLFASFTLFTEQPFIVGDDIELGSMIGSRQSFGCLVARRRTGQLVGLVLLNISSWVEDGNGRHMNSLSFASLWEVCDLE